jgi:hypothetical protein
VMQVPRLRSRVDPRSVANVRPATRLWLSCDVDPVRRRRTDRASRGSRLCSGRELVHASNRMVGDTGEGFHECPESTHDRWSGSDCFARVTNMGAFPPQCGAWRPLQNSSSRAYQPTTHYLKAVAALGVESGLDAINWMKANPSEEDCFGRASIRADGRFFDYGYLFQVKKPSQSKATWDLFNVLSSTRRIRRSDRLRRVYVVLSGGEEALVPLQIAEPA